MSSTSLNETSVLETSGAQKLLIIELRTANDDDRAVYLTGNFNRWRTADPNYRMVKHAVGHYSYAFQLDTIKDLPSVEYKFVKGGWEGEELDNDGTPTENHAVIRHEGKVTNFVSRWKMHENWYDPNYYPIIEIASKQFHLPQLQRKRRISVLLPYDYYKNPHKHYPVLYLQDGQNLFGDTAPYGTWGVDRQMARLAQEGHGDLIIVAIDHGGKSRIAEYSPVTTRQFGEGLGKDYARFLTETLKPYIDQNYRTLTDRAHTGIGGSSMGGLISLYAGLLYPNVFSKYMILSPSLWLTPGMFEAFRVAKLDSDTAFYFFAGGKEPVGTVRHVRMLHQIIQSKNIRHVSSHLEIDREATHQEYFWGRTFPIGIKHLYR